MTSVSSVLPLPEVMLHGGGCYEFSHNNLHPFLWTIMLFYIPHVCLHFFPPMPTVPPPTTICSPYRHLFFNWGLIHISHVWQLYDEGTFLFFSTTKPLPLFTGIMFWFFRAFSSFLLSILFWYGMRYGRGNLCNPMQPIDFVLASLISLYKAYGPNQSEEIKLGLLLGFSERKMIFWWGTENRGC